MGMGTWKRRLAVTGCAVALGLGAGAPFASAAQPPAPAPPVAPITLSPEESQQLCQDMLPRLDRRVDTLVKRINGGPEIKGSVQNLKARAQDQRAKGHTRLADRLDRRAQRRAGRIDDLNQVKSRLDGFRSAHCVPAGGGK